MSSVERLLECEMTDDTVVAAVELETQFEISENRQVIKPNPANRTNWRRFACNLFNTINHMLIGSVAVYFTFFSFKHGWGNHGVLHAILTVLGYQLLMAEAIMALYSGNSWTQATNRDSKKTIHWVMQVVGSTMCIAGISIRIDHKERDHFKSVHAITGLISMIFLIITCLNGISALWARELRTYVKPVYSKFLHNITALVAFVVGMVSLYYGYETKYMERRADEDQRLWLKVAAIVTTVLSLPGALLTIYGQFKTIFFSQ